MGAVITKPAKARKVLNQADVDAWIAHLSGSAPSTSLDSQDLVKCSFENLPLQKVTFRKCKFEECTFQGAHLTQVTFDTCDLTDCSFRDLTFSETRFEKCVLDRAFFSGASAGLRFVQGSARQANFTDLQGLSPSVFESCNLRDASLPKAIDVKELLDRLEARSASANKAFATLLAVCGYTLLSNATLADAGLFTTTQYTAKLPILNVDIPTASFYLFAPFVVLGVYGNFHMEAMRLWQTAGGVPLAVSDGSRLADRIKPWILTGVIDGSLIHSPVSVRLKHWWNLTIISWLGWGSGPITIAALLGKAVKSHQGPTIGLHAVATIVASFWAMWLYWRMQSSLGWANSVGRRWIFWSWVTSVFTTIFVILCVRGAYAKQEGLDQAWQRFRGFYAPFADLRDADISTRPGGWKADGPDSFLAIRPARLNGRDLRYAYAESSFLGRADLNNANLNHISLDRADLRRASLTYSLLKFANLKRADVREVDFTGANLQNANLTELKGTSAIFRNASLVEATLSKAVLGYQPTKDPWMRTGKGADFTSANLHMAKLIETAAQGANFFKADLSNARLDRSCFVLTNLIGANLNGAIGGGCDFTKAELDTSILDNADLTQSKFLQAGLRGSSGVSLKIRLSNLRKADLSAANWRSADLTNVNLDAVNLDGSNFFRCQFTFVRGAIASANGAIFTDCWFNGARLNKSDLRGATFYNCRFHRADFDGANVSGAIFSNCVFTEADAPNIQADLTTIVSPKSDWFPYRSTHLQSQPSLPAKKDEARND